MNSFSINKVTLLGSLGKDPERKGEKATLDLATSIRWKDKNSGEWKEKTTWHNNVEVWNKTADYVENNLHQGDIIHVEGELKTSSWETDDGQKRSRYFVSANQINLVERNTKNQEPRDNAETATYGPEKTASEQSKSTNQKKQNESAPLVEDDVPF